jgi:hypothetical protein
MKKQVIICIGVILLTFSAFAQDNVGIGTVNPHSSALLDLSSTSKGLLIPRVTLVAANNGTTPINSPATGLMVYNSGGSLSAGFYYWDGTQWVQIGAGGSTGECVTLNQAYNCNGSGAGRVINSNAGAVEINLTGGGNKALIITTNIAQSFGVDITQSNTGVGIRSQTTLASNQFPAIQAETNSSVANNAAILGQNTGAGYGIAGQIPQTATGTSAVFGNNLRTNGGSGLRGEGYNGVVGFANNGVGFGLYGSNLNANGLGIGTYGVGFHGVYGQTTDIVNGWAGFFTADLGAEGGVYAMGPGLFNLSDKRLKKDIVQIDNALNKINKINGLYYTITTKMTNSEGEVSEVARQEYGVIAQDLEKIFPEMISEKVFFKNANDDNHYKSVNYIQLIPVLIEAVKELSNEIEQLKSEIEMLKK